MATTYTSPDTDDKDYVRFLLGDTASGEWLLSDEEIQAMINKWKPLQGSLEYCASVLADNLAARYAREVSHSADGVSINLAQAAQQFRDLAVSLREQHRNALVGGTPDVGGVSPYEGQLPNVRQFAFGTGMHDDKSAGSQDFGSRDHPDYYPEDAPGF